MQIVANHMYLLLRSNPHKNNAVMFCFLFSLVICLFRVLFGSFLDFSLFRLSDCLCMLLFVYARLSDGAKLVTTNP